MLSVVIPTYNESLSLEPLHKELAEIAAANDYDMEIIFVDDGSIDDSWQVIERLAAKDSRVRGVRFRRNFGKSAALSAGVSHASGVLVVTLDADLQDDPHEIPHFLAALGDKYDLVSGWKRLRHDPWNKVIPSRVFNAMVSWLTGVELHDHNCGMKCYRREIFDEISLYGEMHRFIPALAAARGFRIGEIEIKHRPRRFGQSKFGVSRIVKGFLDLLTVKFLTAFGQRPQHILGSIGLLAFVIGAGIMTVLAGYWLVSRIPVFGLAPIQLHERPALLYSVALLLMGGQFLSVGILGELFISYHRPERRSYSISEKIGVDSSPKEEKS